MSAPFLDELPTDPETKNGLRQVRFPLCSCVCHKPRALALHDLIGLDGSKGCCLQGCSLECQRRHELCMRRLISAGLQQVFLNVCRAWCSCGQHASIGTGI